jgi:MYXO-CTERM domain-containing protein
VEATVFVTGLTTTTFSTKTWAKSLLPFMFGITTSVTRSEIAMAHLSGVFGYQVGISDIGLTITLDLIVNVEGTAHVVPDPALGGLTAMGLAGAGAWLRRRS